MILRSKEYSATNIKSQAPSKQRRRWSIFSIVSVFVVACIALFVLIVGLQQWIAKGRVDAEHARLRSLGYPVDNQSLAQWFAKSSSSEKTDQWNEILAVVANTDWRELPILGNGKLPSELLPEIPWPQEREVAKTLKEMQPLLEQIYTAAKSDRPVWMPIEFNGIDTLLGPVQSSRTVLRLLQLEFAHALYHRDTGRAMKTLEGMQGTSAAFNWQICQVCSMVHLAFEGQLMGSIGQSLSCNVWDDALLVEISTYVNQPLDLDANFNAAVIGERGFVLSAFDQAQSTSNGTALPFWLLRVPSVRAKLLSEWRSLELSSGIGWANLKGRLASMEIRKNRWSGLEDAVIRMSVLGIDGFGNALQRQEQQRRLTLTAINIKRFQLKHKRFPKVLSELAEFGLKEVDWSTVDLHSFGYQIDESAGSEVGKSRALVWGVQQSTAIAILQPEVTPPKPTDDGDMPEYVVSIR